MNWTIAPQTKYDGVDVAGTTNVASLLHVTLKVKGWLDLTPMLWCACLVDKKDERLAGCRAIFDTPLQNIIFMGKYMLYFMELRACNDDGFHNAAMRWGHVILDSSNGIPLGFHVGLTLTGQLVTVELLDATDRKIKIKFHNGGEPYKKETGA